MLQLMRHALALLAHLLLLGVQGSGACFQFLDCLAELVLQRPLLALHLLLADSQQPARLYALLTRLLETPLEGGRALPLLRTSGIRA